MGNSLPERKKHSGVRYAIYTRQSANDDGKVLSSCEAQFGICEDFVNGCADPTWRWIGERLDDVGFTGADTNRPALQRLLRLVREGRIDKVVVYGLDRLTRSLRVTSPELGSAATDALLLNLMALFAQFEREMIRARLADTRAALKRHGCRLAGRVPYGYNVDSRTKQFVVNAGEAGRVREMFQMAADGMLPREIAAARRKGKWSGGRRSVWLPRMTHQEVCRYEGASTDIVRTEMVLESITPSLDDGRETVDFTVPARTIVVGTSLDAPTEFSRLGFRSG